MSAIERWRARTPEPTPTELAWKRHELTSLNDRIAGWETLDRIRISAVVTHGALEVAARVFTAASYYEQRRPEDGDVYRTFAEDWAIGAHSELMGFHQRRQP